MPTRDNWRPIVPGWIIWPSYAPASNDYQQHVADEANVQRRNDAILRRAEVQPVAIDEDQPDGDRTYQSLRDRRLADFERRLGEIRDLNLRSAEPETR